MVARDRGFVRKVRWKSEGGAGNIGRQGIAVDYGGQPNWFIVRARSDARSRLTIDLVRVLPLVASLHDGVVQQGDEVG